MTEPRDYGLLAEFPNTPTLIHAAEELNAKGYRRADAYTPFPVEELAEALGQKRTRIPLVVLTGALIGGISGYLLQWWICTIDYPLNIGGRPAHSWPAFVPITFEMTILTASLFAVLGMLGLNGLPRPHHPLFGVPAFARASVDGYFLCIEATDPQFDNVVTRRLLMDLGAKEVWSVPDVA
jgi:hypothetical protein